MKFDDDWTGVFIRGDVAHGFKHTLEGIMARYDLQSFELEAVQSLIELFHSSDERTAIELPQLMLSFDQCMSAEERGKRLRRGA